MKGRTSLSNVIFKRSQEGRPYPRPQLSRAEWDALPLEMVALADLIATRRIVDVDKLLGDPGRCDSGSELRVVEYEGELFIESGLHSALRAALQLRTGLPARVLVLK